MTDMLTNLSDAYLADIAAYYAAQTPAHAAPPAAPPEDQATLAKQLIDKGDASREIPACSDCHGKSLKGIAPAIPGLLGLRSEYLAAQIGAWKADVRHAAEPDCMGQIAKALTPQEVDALSQWIASRPYPADPSPEAARHEPMPMPCGAMP